MCVYIYSYKCISLFRSVASASDGFRCYCCYCCYVCRSRVVDMLKCLNKLSQDALNPQKFLHDAMRHEAYPLLTPHSRPLHLSKKKEIEARATAQHFPPKKPKLKRKEREGNERR